MTGIEKEAIAWYKESFDGHFSLIKTTPYRWFYSCQILTFEILGLGGYNFRFIIQMAHFEFWNVPQFNQGFMHGRKSSKIDVSRDDNPYTENNFYFNSAWDAGYICGLNNFKFFKKLHKE